MYYKNIIVFLFLILRSNGQQWYTATLNESEFSFEDGGFKPIFFDEAKKPDSAVSPKNIHYARKPELTKLFYLNEQNHESNFVPSFTSETPTYFTTRPNPTKNAIPFPYKFESVETIVVEPDTVIPPKKHKEKYQHLFSQNNTITNINIVSSKRKHPKRRLVKKCPSRPYRRKSSKKSKFLNVFQIVEFQNEVCTSSNGLEGVCLHEFECKTSGGRSMGRCADGYGTCCVTQLTCGEQTSAWKSWFTNPDFPLPNSDRLSCVLTLEKARLDVQQIRLDFLNFELLHPEGGSCDQDQFSVTGQNINNIVPILCGTNNGQHIYIEVNDVEGPIYLSVQTVTADSRLFAIKISQILAGQELAAPRGCLQYYKEPVGVLESFNYQDISTITVPKIPSYLNNLNYAMCIERAKESCSITYTNTGEMSIVNYDTDGLPLIPPNQAGVEIFNCPNDWLLIAAARLCGDRLNDGSVFQDFSMDAPVTDIAAGPIVVWFKSDGTYTGRGFRLKYQQNACANPN